MTPTPAEPTTSIRRRAASLGRYRRWPVPAERGGRASKRWQQWSLPSPLGSDVRALSGRRVVGPDSLTDASHGALNLVTNSFQHSGVLCVGRNVEGDRPPMRGRQPPDRSPCARAPGSRSLHMRRRVDHPPDVLTPGWLSSISSASVIGRISTAREARTKPRNWATSGLSDRCASNSRSTSSNVHTATSTGTRQDARRDTPRPYGRPPSFGPRARAPQAAPNRWSAVPSRSLRSGRRSGCVRVWPQPRLSSLGITPPVLQISPATLTKSRPKARVRRGSAAGHRAQPGRRGAENGAAPNDSSSRQSRSGGDSNASFFRTSRSREAGSPAELVLSDGAE